MRADIDEEGGRNDEDGKACKSFFKEEDLIDGRKREGGIEEEEESDVGGIGEGLIKYGEGGGTVEEGGGREEEGI